MTADTATAGRPVVIIAAQSIRHSGDGASTGEPSNQEEKPVLGRAILWLYGTLWGLHLMTQASSLAIVPV